MRVLLSILLIIFNCISTFPQDGKIAVYRTDTGLVSFISDAPLEMITARSNELKGAVDPAKMTFAFQLEVKTLRGFNSPLQQEHFYENYIESEKYPFASFSGRIIEKIGFGKPGTYTVRAKGIFSVHGVDQERIINCIISVKEKGFTVDSEFTVPLSDHDISIPKLVYQKIAEEIKVTVQAEFLSSENYSE